MRELTLPELGEGIEVVDVTSVLVSVGDTIRRDQPVIEVETEKAGLEVPSTFDGTVTELLVKVGDKLEVGRPILRAEDTGASAGATDEPRPEPASLPASPKAPTPDEPAPSPVGVASLPIAFPAVPDKPRIGPTAPASPSARALARQLGVDILQVKGTRLGGRISREDVKAHTKAIITASPTGAPAAEPSRVPHPALPNFTAWGPVRRESLSGLRKAAARNLSNAWTTIPHVTQFDHSDITDLEAMRKRQNKRIEKENKLTMTGIVIKIVASALKQFPKFNASLDLEQEAVVYKEYFHIGFAADTRRGLVVPVVRDVDRKGLLSVCSELNKLAARARSRKVTPDEMRGASFTVTNLGGLGTTYFSPIVNWPEVAILGLGRAKLEPVYEEGTFQPRLVLPLSLSYDHRWIDGADAARFLRWLAETLEQPLMLAMDDIER